MCHSISVRLIVLAVVCMIGAFLPACGLAASELGRIMPLTEVLGEFEKGTDDWRLSLGKEYPGAKGDSRQDATTVHSGKASLRLSGDFSAGGRYVAIERKLDPALELAALRFWVKAESLTSMTLRLTDATGQTHQQDIKLEPKPDWQEIVIKRFTGPIAWGGAGDKQWHGPATAISLMVEAAGVIPGGKVGTLWLDDLSADTGAASQAASAQAATEGRPAKVTAKLEIAGRPFPFYWGSQDVPGKVTVVISTDGASATVSELRLQDYMGKDIAKLWSGSAAVALTQPFRQEITLALPAYGQYYIVAAGVEGRVRTSLAWCKAKGQPWPEGPFGAQTHFVHGPAGGHDQLGGAEATLALVRDMGAGWIRDEGNADPGYSGPFAYDAARVKNGLMELNILDHRIDNKSPITEETRQQWCEAVKQRMERKSRFGVNLYEVWNEPNIGPGWKREPDAAQYFELLKSAYTTVKSVDHKATVIGMALSEMELAYVEEVLKLGGAKYMDALSCHPYHGAAPEVPFRANVRYRTSPKTVHSFPERVEALKALLDKYDAGHLKIWFTEYGWVTDDFKTGKPAYLCAWWEVRQHILGMKYPYVAGLCKYNFQDRKGEGWDKRMGNVTIDESGGPGPRPSFVAYNTMSRMLHKAKFVRAIAGEGATGPYCFEFSGPGGTVYAAWMVEGTGSVAVDCPAAGATLTDLMGNEKRVQPDQGRLTLQLAESPVFVTVGSGDKAEAPK